MLFEHSYRIGFDIYARLFDETKNESVSVKIPSQVEYYKPMQNGPYRCIFDKNLRLQKYFGTSKDAKGWYGITRPIDRYVRDNFWKTGYNMSPRIWYLDIETRSGQNSVGFPLPESALEEVTLIQIYDTVLNTMVVLGRKNYVPQEGYDLPYPVKYMKCSSEGELLENFLKVFEKLNPLIVYAWNGENFDYPYLYNRLKNLGYDKNKLSNYGKVTLEQSEKNGRTVFKFNSEGHYFIDLIDVYKKIVLKPRPSYSLDTISGIELGEHKVEHTEFRTFDSFYTGKDYEIASEPYSDKVREQIRLLKIKERDGTITAEESEELEKLISFQFVYYGVIDVYLLKRLDDKINMTSIIMGIAQMMGCNFKEALATIRPWSCGLQNEYYKLGYVFPKTSEDDQIASVVGGFVRDPIRGRHKWILSFDYNSMYPMLSMNGFNMSPETFVPIEKCPEDLKVLIQKYLTSQDEHNFFKIPEEDKQKIKELLQKYNFTLSVNGALFDKSQKGVIPKLVLDIYKARKQDKKTMLKYEQMKEKAGSMAHSAVSGVRTSLKDPLEYTDDELKSLCKEDLTELARISGNKETFFEAQQHTKKILINSLYGAVTKSAFPGYLEKMAQAITGNGRAYVQNTANYIEEGLQKIKKFEGKYVAYGDTDSVAYDTIINTNKGDIQIGDLYNIPGETKVLENGTYIKIPSEDIEALSFGKDFNIEPKKIKYIMKHKVSKKLYKIKCNNNYVVLTEDHSVMVVRDGKLLECKPSEIIAGDRLVVNQSNEWKLIASLTTDFEIEDLGVQELDVYDIEVDDNHNFFGNNILVHNSAYYTIAPIMEDIIRDNPGKTTDEYVNLADDFEKTNIDPLIQKSIKDLSDYLNVYDISTIGAKREIIADAAIFVAKKRYIARVRDSEGVRYPADDPHIKIMGLELAKSATPNWCKKKINESLDILLDGNEQDLKKWIDSVKKEFIKAEIKDISFNGSCSSISYDLGKDKAIPWMNKAAIIYNNYVKKIGKENIYPLVQPGEKCKIIFLKAPNPFGSDRIAWVNESFIPEFKNYIDYDECFRKFFLDTLNNMVSELGYNIYKETEDLDEW